MSLNEQLILMHRLLNRAWNERNDLALSFSEFEYLTAVYEAEKLDEDIAENQHSDHSHLSSIAEALAVKKPSASTMINKLIKKELVFKEDCPYDARAQHIMLTDHGRALLLSTHVAIYNQLANQIKDTMGAEKAKNLTKLLKKLA